MWSSRESGRWGFVMHGCFMHRMLHFVNPSQYPSIPNCTAVGSSIISDVLKTVKPRYHFAASMVRFTQCAHSQNIFYERRPYRNASQHITRIVCLGPVKAGSDKSRKWLHALNLTPCIQMPESELIEADANCTPSALRARKASRRNSTPFPGKKRPERETPCQPAKLPLRAAAERAVRVLVLFSVTKRGKAIDREVDRVFGVRG